MVHGELDQEHRHQHHGLRLIRSPITNSKTSASSDALSTIPGRQGSGLDIGSLGFRDGPNHDCPEFERHEEATNIEVFYDLFFAANLSVFSEVHDVTDVTKLTSYIGYFCILWLTWALTGLYDVRFVTDSIFERIARASHLGVMVGFAVVAPNFSPDNQVKVTFRTMSIILMASRLTLAAQYASIIWHVREYRNTKIPLGIMVGVNFVSAMIYLGITFRFQDHNSSVYVAWYVIAILEIIIGVVLSLYWRVLSFKGTHLINRVSLLTFIIIGEGIIVVCMNVTRIVVNVDSWTSPTIGNVLAGITNLYIVYMIYFDWRRHLHLPPSRQLIWTLLHFPFHLALALFVEGSSQFVIWWKILEVIDGAGTRFNSALSSNDSENFNVTTAWLVDTLNSTVNSVFELYNPKYYDTYVDVNNAINTLAKVPDEYWNTPMNDTDPWTIAVDENLKALFAAVENSLFASFNIDGFAGAKDFSGSGSALELQVNEENWSRFFLVFIYSFIAAGITLILMNILFILSRTDKRWTPFNYIRCVINFLVGIGLCLTTSIATSGTLAGNFEATPWPLPTILIVYFFIFVLTHLPHPPFILFAKREPGTGTGTNGNGNGNLDGRRSTSAEKASSSLQEASTQGNHNGGYYQTVNYGGGHPYSGGDDHGGGQMKFREESRVQAYPWT